MSDVKGPDHPVTVTNVAAGDTTTYTMIPPGPDGYGTHVVAYGCQPVDTGEPPSVPWVPQPGQAPWFPQPEPIIVTLPAETPLNPPRECKYCEHLFATVEDFNNHIDGCREEYRKGRRRAAIDRIDGVDR